jgi:hypothetical protein
MVHISHSLTLRIYYTNKIVRKNGSALNGYNKFMRQRYDYEINRVAKVLSDSILLEI